MSKDPTFGIPRGEDEREVLAQIVAESFHQPSENITERIEQVGNENLRVVREGKQVVACLWLVPMGQWFGGKSIPMTGIAVVGVSPGARGKGSASHLMTSTMRDLREMGVPLSGLYPATQSLYRLAGYELAGSRWAIKTAAKDIRIKDRELPLRPATAEDLDAIHETYQAKAQTQDGHLDRGPYVWDRVQEYRKRPTTPYVVEEGGRITGYVYVLPSPPEKWPFSIQLTDIAALTPGAGRRLWTFLADHRSMVEEISWYGGPNDPFLMLPRERNFEMELQMYWMIRVLDVKGALEARGYPRSLRGEWSLEIEDNVIPENTGRYLLEVEGGSARVRKGGNGSLRMHIRGLAPLFSGFLSPENLRMAGLLEGEPESVEAAAQIFNGTAPWMPDMF